VDTLIFMTQMVTSEKMWKSKPKTTERSQRAILVAFACGPRERFSLFPQVRDLIAGTDGAQQSIGILKCGETMERLILLDR